MGEMAIMGRQGDTKIIWEPSNKPEVDAARKSFDDLRGKGYLAFSVEGDGSKGKQIFTFEPHAAKIILSPPMRGGF